MFWGNIVNNDEGANGDSAVSNSGGKARARMGVQVGTVLGDTQGADDDAFNSKLLLTLCLLCLFHLLHLFAHSCFHLYQNHYMLTLCQGSKCLPHLGLDPTQLQITVMKFIVTMAGQIVPKDKRGPFNGI